MAMTNTTPTSPPASETGIAGKKLPSNPTPLSAPQEQQVRDIYYRNVREKCAEEIKGTSPPSHTLPTSSSAHQSHSISVAYPPPYLLSMDGFH